MERFIRLRTAVCGYKESGYGLELKTEMYFEPTGAELFINVDHIIWFTDNLVQLIGDKDRTIVMETAEEIYNMICGGNDNE